MTSGFNESTVTTGATGPVRGASNRVWIGLASRSSSSGYSQRRTISGSDSPLAGVSAALAASVIIGRSAVRYDRRIDDARLLCEDILDTIRDALLVLDEDLRVVQANRLVCEVFRVSIDDTEGRLLYEPGNGQWNISRLRLLLEQVLPAHEGVRDFWVEREFPDIGRRIMRLDARRIRGADNNSTSIPLVLQDVTEREDAERVVREHRESLRVTLASVGDAVRSPAERALREGVIVGLANHTLLIDRNGAERPIDDSAAPIRDTNGTVVGCVLVFRDVTERHAARRAIEFSEAIKTAMLETALDCIITIDSEGAVIEFNAAAEKTFGYRREDVLGKELATLIIPSAVRERFSPLTCATSAIAGRRRRLRSIFGHYSRPRPDRISS